jgi:hypothetical protein
MSDVFAARPKQPESNTDLKFHWAGGFFDTKRGGISYWDTLAGKGVVGVYIQHSSKPAADEFLRLFKVGQIFPLNKKWVWQAIDADAKSVLEKLLLVSRMKQDEIQDALNICKSYNI